MVWLWGVVSPAHQAHDHDQARNAAALGGGAERRDQSSLGASISESTGTRWAVDLLRRKVRALRGHAVDADSEPIPLHTKPLDGRGSAKRERTRSMSTVSSMGGPSLSSLCIELSGYDVATQLWRDGYVGYSEMLADQFYDMGTELPAALGLSASQRLPPLSELAARLALLPVPDYVEVVCVDLRRDRALEQLKQQVKRQICHEQQLVSRVKGLAELVAEHLGGSAASSLALRSKWEVSRAWQNGDGTAHRLVLIGERRAASTLRHRLLLFKMLAPLVRISCRLEASEQPGELQCVLLVGNQLHAVDLVVEPGALACLPASKLVGALRMALHPPATELERTEQHGSLHEPFYVPASLLQERYSALSLMSSNSLGIGTDEMSESTAPLMHHLDPRSRRASVPESRRFNLSEDHLESSRREPDVERRRMPRHSVSHAPQRTTYSITPPSAASLMRPVTCDSVPGASHREPPVVHRRGSRISRQRSAASSQGKKSVSSPVATLMHELSDAPRPVDLSRRRSSVAGSQTADTFVDTRCSEYSVENTFISVPSEHFTSGPGSVCLADTALHASQPSTGSGRNSNSTAKKVGLAQIVVLLQQEERERKQQHAAAAMLYDLECWARVDRWVQAQAADEDICWPMAATMAATGAQLDHTPSSSSAGSLSGGVRGSRTGYHHPQAPMNTPVSTPAESLYALGSSVQSGESAPSDASSHGESQQQNTSSDTEGASIAAHAAHWLGPLEASELDVADVEMFECIGNGSCGSVHRGRWMGAEVAVKYFEPTTAVVASSVAAAADPTSQNRSASSVSDFLHEAQLLLELRHPNVLLFIGVLTKPKLAIVTEYLPRGSLFRLLHSRSLGTHHQMDARRRVRMALDTARAVMYLHAIDIVHCDIKSANLLVDKNWVVKVCDFGLSRKVSGGLADGLNSMQGTFRWMAPELLRRWLMTGPDKLSNEPVTKQMDVYSFGVVMWELFTNQEPWKGFTFQQVTNMVALQKGKLEVPSYVDDTVGTLINSCLSNDPNLRPRFAEIVGVLRPLVKTLDVEHHAVMRPMGSSRNSKQGSRRTSDHTEPGYSPGYSPSHTPSRSNQSSRNTSRASSRATSPRRHQQQHQAVAIMGSGLLLRSVSAELEQLAAAGRDSSQAAAERLELEGGAATGAAGEGGMDAGAQLGGGDGAHMPRRLPGPSPLGAHSTPVPRAHMARRIPGPSPLGASLLDRAQSSPLVAVQEQAERSESSHDEAHSQFADMSEAQLTLMLAPPTPAVTPPVGRVRRLSTREPLPERLRTKSDVGVWREPLTRRLEQPGEEPGGAWSAPPWVQRAQSDGALPHPTLRDGAEEPEVLRTKSESALQGSGSPSARWRRTLLGQVVESALETPEEEQRRTRRRSRDAPVLRTKSDGALLPRRRVPGLSPLGAGWHAEAAVPVPVKEFAELAEATRCQPQLVLRTKLDESHPKVETLLRKEPKPQSPLRRVSYATHSPEEKDDDR